MTVYKEERGDLLAVFYSWGEFKAYIYYYRMVQQMWDGLMAKAGCAVEVKRYTVF